MAAEEGLGENVRKNELILMTKKQAVKLKEALLETASKLLISAYKMAIN